MQSARTFFSSHLQTVTKIKMIQNNKIQIVNSGGFTYLLSQFCLYFNWDLLEDAGIPRVPTKKVISGTMQGQYFFFLTPQPNSSLTPSRDICPAGLDLLVFTYCNTSYSNNNSIWSLVDKMFSHISFKPQNISVKDISFLMFPRNKQFKPLNLENVIIFQFSILIIQLGSQQIIFI